MFKRKKQGKNHSMQFTKKMLNKAITKQKHDNNPQNSQRMLMQGIVILYCGA